MYDVIVVGGGFWGVAIARSLRGNGADVALIDDHNPNGASRNAAGIVDWSWYRGDTIRKMLPEWMLPRSKPYATADLSAGRALLDTAGYQQTGEDYSTYLKPGVIKRRDTVGTIPHPDSVLALAQARPGKVARVTKVNGGWRAFGTHVWDAKQLVLATGAWTDELLAASGLSTIGVKPLLGRALLARGPQLERPRTHVVRPYTMMTLRAMPGGLCRIGDTVERHNDTGRAMPLVGYWLEQLAPGAKVERVLSGYRPVLDQMIAGEHVPGLFVATGGHRVGLGLAGTIGEHIAGLVA